MTLFATYFVGFIVIFYLSTTVGGYVDDVGDRGFALPTGRSVSVAPAPPDDLGRPPAPTPQ